MIKSEPKSDRVLRSASPHRNAYKSDFHSIKCSFEGPSLNYSNGSGEARGRPSGNRVNKIKNIFLQMDGQQAQDGAVFTKPAPAKFQRAPSTSYRSSMSSVSSMESATSETARKVEDIPFDKVALAEKFSETRKLFESGLKDQAPTERAVPGRPSVSEEARCARKLSEKMDQAQKTGEQLQLERWRSESETPLRKSGLMMKNAGPISRRLESFMLDSDSESLSGPSASTRSQSPSSHSQPPSSPTSERSDPPSSPDSASSPTSYSLWHESPAGQADSCPNQFSKGDPQHQVIPVNGVCVEETPDKSTLSETSVSILATEPTVLFKSKKSHRLSQGSGSDSPSGEGTEGCSEAETSREKQGKTGTPGLATVRAERVVVQNESSESEANEEDRIEDDVFEPTHTNHLTERERVDSGEVQETLQEKESGRSFGFSREEEKRQGVEHAQDVGGEDQGSKEKLCEEKSMQKEEGEAEDEEEEKEDKGKAATEDGNEQVQEDPSLHSEMKECEQKVVEMEQSTVEDEHREKEEDEEDEEDEDLVEEGVEALEEEEEEDEHEFEESQQQVNHDLAGKRPLICGIENAAFVDDREIKPELEYPRKREQPEELQVYEELPGLPDEEGINPRRKIRFSTAPIKVR